jgi:hypothetical protein
MSPPIQNPPNPKQRFGDAKPNLALIPGTAELYLADGLGEGAVKYGPFNWRETPVEVMTYIAGCMRHLRSYQDGEEIDPDGGRHHLGKAMANLAIIIDALECGMLIDNRPNRAPTAENIRRMSAARLAAMKAADAVEIVESATARRLGRLPEMLRRSSLRQAISAAIRMLFQARTQPMPES